VACVARALASSGAWRGRIVCTGAGRFSSRAAGPCYGQDDADELVLELLVLAALDGLVEEVLLGARRLLEAGVEGGGGTEGRRDREGVWIPLRDLAWPPGRGPISTGPPTLTCRNHGRTMALWSFAVEWKTV
jgi:hypothetical protein